jgi:AAA family ATP:ADP antiporter
VAHEAAAAFRERPRELIGLCVLAFLVLASYGIARPAIESLFLARPASGSLPWVWLTVAVVIAAATAFYNRLAAVLPLATLWGQLLISSGAVLAILLGALWLRVPYAAFALYVWKDIYIVFAIELFWSIANLSHPIRRARWIYGVFLVAGSAGSISSELCVGPLAGAVGTGPSLVVVLVILALAAVGGRLLPDVARRGPDEGERLGGQVFVRGIRLLRRSRYLLLLLLLIGVVQIVITLIDFQYNAAMEHVFPDVDERTNVGGKIYASINTAALVLQLLSGVLLRLAGAPLILVSIPLLLGAGVGWFVVLPRFLSVAAVKIASKAFDYSLFRAAKELLYIPLPYADKTEGKALIDILAYRVGKGFASAMILWLGLLELSGQAINAAIGVLLAFWLVLVAVIARRFRPDQC